MHPSKTILLSIDIYLEQSHNIFAQHLRPEP